MYIVHLICWVGIFLLEVGSAGCLVKKIKVEKTHLSQEKVNIRPVLYCFSMQIINNTVFELHLISGKLCTR